MFARVVLGLVLMASLPGQKVLWQRDGVRDQYSFFRAPVVGDLNGDGWEDVAAFVTTAGSVDNNELWFLSGRDGTTVRRRPEYAPGWVYQSVARAGDMNGDGVPDYLFHAYNVYANFEGVAELASGVDDAPLWRIGPSPGLILGLTLLGELDLDGDRRPDFLAGNERDRAAAIHAYDNTGRELYTVAIPPELTALGGNQPEAFASLGDYDGDGAPERTGPPAPAPRPGTWPSRESRSSPAAPDRSCCCR